MRVNIFKINYNQKDDLLKKFKNILLVEEGSKNINGWNFQFFLSQNPEIADIAWVNDFQDFLNKKEIKNKIYFATLLCEKNQNLFALTFGKAHFYARQFCDEEFGLDMAKRIANRDYINLFASKRFAGNKKKEIKAYVDNSSLNEESGESVDYISAKIIAEKQKFFAKKAKFGASFNFSNKELTIEKLDQLLEKITEVLLESEKFQIPKIEEVSKQDSTKFDDMLKDVLLGNNESDVETNNNSFDIVGVDFNFYYEENFVIKHDRKKSEIIKEISIKDVKNFIQEHRINKEKILNIKIEIGGDNKTYTKQLKEFLECKIHDKNIILHNGKWKKFNGKYINLINKYIDERIEILTTEEDLKNISVEESVFNKNLENFGYKKLDKQFLNLEKHKIEICDAKKEDVQYAVKIGTSQKLTYVCSQAILALEIFRNNENENFEKPKSFCLWFIFDKEREIKKISEIKSIMLKSNIDEFVRKCLDLGIKPCLKFSYKNSSGTKSTTN